MYVWNDNFIIPFQSVDLVRFERRVYFIGENGGSNFEKSIVISCKGERITLEGEEMETFLMRYKEYLHSIDKKSPIGFRLPDHCSEIVF